MTEKQAVEAFRDIFTGTSDWREPDFKYLRHTLENGGDEFINSKYTFENYDIDEGPMRGTVLHHAIFEMNSTSIDGVRILLEFGADVNARTDSGLTPMEISSSTWCNPDVFKFLSENGGIFNRNPVEYLLDFYCCPGHLELVDEMVRHGITFTYDDIKTVMRTNNYDMFMRFSIAVAILYHIKLTKEEAEHLIYLIIKDWTAFEREVYNEITFQEFISLILLVGKTVVEPDMVTRAISIEEFPVLLRGRMINEFPYTDVLKKYQDPFEVILDNVTYRNGNFLREYIDFHDEHGWKITKEMIERVEALTEDYLEGKFVLNRENQMEVANYLRMKRTERALQFNATLREMGLRELPDDVKRKMFNEYMQL